MKHMLISFLVLHTAFGDVGYDKTERSQQIKQLLAQMMRHDDAYLSYSAVFAMQTHAGWMKYPEFGELKEKVSGNWREILDTMEEVAPSEIHKVVILLASVYSLPSQDSRQCLSKIADLCLDGVISNEMFLWAIVKHEENTEPKHRLSQNVNDPAVTEVLRKIKEIDPENEYYIRKTPWTQKRNETNGKAAVSPATGSNGTPLASAEGNRPNSITTIKNGPSEDTSIGNNALPWKLSLLAGILAMCGFVATWRCFRRRR
ncbi:MAG: hypothetical protein FWH21_06930 [Kiritimatiellaeota bacterium]|nr:hypothetical protein [Kiritimatiellota bacterium]